MSEQARALRVAFESANDELIQTIEACSDEQWRAVTVAEGWSVGVAAHHIADDHPMLASWVQSVAAGKEVVSYAPEFVAQFNAQHAAQHAGCTKDETIELLRQNAAPAAEAIGNLTDPQLATTAPALGQPAMTARDMIEHVLVGHIYMHLASIRQAIGSTSAVANGVAASR